MNDELISGDPIGQDKNFGLGELMREVVRRQLAVMMLPAEVMRDAHTGSYAESMLQREIFLRQVVVPKTRPGGRCEEHGHLWSSWRTERHNEVYVKCRTPHPGMYHRDGCQLGCLRPVESEPFSVCLRSGCNARMTLETTLPAVADGGGS